MKRTTHPILTFLSVLSLLLCMATLLLWLRSYFVDDQFGIYSYTSSSFWRVTERRTGLFSSDGRLTWSQRFDSSITGPFPVKLLQPRDHLGFFTAAHHGFNYWYDERDETFICGFGLNGGIASVPHLFVAVFFAILPLWLATFHRDRNRARHLILLMTYITFLVLGVMGTTTFHFILIPIAALAIPIVFLIVLGAWAVKLFKAASDEKYLGLCPTCGYDLRATPNRCPECGNIPLNTTALLTFW